MPKKESQKQSNVVPFAPLTSPNVINVTKKTRRAGFDWPLMKPEHSCTVFRYRISGIPCQVQVFFDEPMDIGLFDFRVYDRTGHPAQWLTDKLTWSEVETLHTHYLGMINALDDSKLERTIQSLYPD